MRKLLPWGFCLSILPALCGSAAAQDIAVNSFTTSIQMDPNLAVAPGGEFVVVWLSFPSPNPADDLSSIVGRRFAADGTPIDTDFVVNTSLDHEEKYSAVAFRADASFVVAWGEIDAVDSYHQVRQRSFPFAGGGGPEEAISGGSGVAELFPALAVNGGHERLAWQRYHFDTQSASIEVSGAGTVNSSTAGWRLLPKVSIDDDGSFVVVWHGQFSSGDDDSGASVQARRFAATGLPLGPELQVNTVTAEWQSNADVAHLADGSFVVVWQSRTSAGDDNDDFSVQARRFLADGSPVGPEFQVNTYTTSGQQQPRIAADDEGNFVVVWSSFGSPGTDDAGASIQAQVFSTAGRRIGPNFQVNQTTAGHQSAPAVARDGQGRFRVAWSNELGAPDFFDIRASQPITFSALFADGFEGGSTGAWSNASP